ncbi:ABC transporter permease [Sagittula sp. S175]|uniref:ABC transporter permease n=1 Tax=Sagittula sp. S175 TaxID=3415129 RepID=UPI003C7DA9FE
MPLAPVLRLSGVTRVFHRGGEALVALDAVDLSISSGEMVAIIGPSGSGKSTLMGIMGCLDRVDAGRVEVLGHPVSEMPEPDIARIRAVSLGFVFQSYHLLPGLTALENVAIAGLYADVPRERAEARARQLLEQVGLADRMDHRPAQLSGGQQQRVAVARALFHERAILLADEPTGALDSKSSANIMALLHRLNDSGRTIVIVTHDPKVAETCGRVIRVEDGKIIAHSATAAAPPPPQETGVPQQAPSQAGRLLRDSFASSLTLMRSRLTRTLLTLVGIVIGITAVIVIVALGDGAKQAVVQTVGSLGRNLIVVMPDDADRPANAEPIPLFTEEERAEVAALDLVQAAVLEMPQTRPVGFQTRATETLVTSTGPDFPLVHDWTVAQGDFFDERDALGMAPVIILGKKVAEQLFPDSDPIGQWMTVDSAFLEVIGVMSEKGANPAGVDLDDVALIPFSTAVLRLGQDRTAQYIMTKTAPGADLDAVSGQIDALLVDMRGQDQAAARTLAGIVSLELQAKSTLTALLAALSMISLVVGAVGITNITLIGVVERTREIGLRKALGARRKDIARQFLVETTVMSVVGGGLGVLFGLLCVLAMKMVGFPAIYNVSAIGAALAMSAVTGILAGVVPARRAAALHPVEALLSP